MINELSKHAVIPVVEIDNSDHAAPLAESLLAGGISVVEVTLRTAASVDSIRNIRKRFPEMLVGAGTVLSENKANEVISAGAGFGVAPGCNSDVVAWFLKAGIPFLPGAITPTEIEAAAGLGCRLLKFFPAEASGGVTYLNALKGPYTGLGIRFCATGGVSLGNMCEYLSCPLVQAVGGSWIATRAQIEAGDWQAIGERARQAVARSREITRPG